MANHFKRIALLLASVLLMGCSPKTGVVNIVSEPGVASIFVDGKLRGITGNLQTEYLTLNLEYGIYEVQAQKPIDANTEFFGERTVVVTEAGDQSINIVLDKRETLLAQSLAAEAAHQKQNDHEEEHEDKEEVKEQAKPLLPELMGEWVSIPGGAFVMGTSDGPADERPAHIVVVPPFRMMATEVTFALWDMCTRDGACTYSPNDEGWGRGDRPVINVSYNDIVKKFIPWLSIKTKRTYSLPSEAQWEYAIRAGTKTKYYWGDDPRDNVANCNNCGSKWDGQRTAPVKSFEPNPFGLYDMGGNVWEWIEDCWNEDYQNATEESRPRYSGVCSQRVLRGGSWRTEVTRLQTTYRNWCNVDRRYTDTGFRLVENTEADWFLDESQWPELPEPVESTLPNPIKEKLGEQQSDSAPDKEKGSTAWLDSE